MPVESTYLTPARLSRTLFLPVSANFLIESRRATLLSPILTSPLKSRMVTSPACRSFTSSSAIVFSVLLFEAVESVCFAVVNVKYSQKFGDCQQVLKFLGEIEQLQLSVLLADGGVTGDQLADTARIDITDTREIKQNALLAFFKQSPDGGAQRNASLTDGYLAAHVKYGHISGLTFVDIQLSHFRNLLICNCD